MAKKKDKEPVTGDDEKSKILAALVSCIEQTQGKGSVIDLNAEGMDFSFETISTGSIKIDEATGIGGLPKGRIIEIYGDFASGKTTLALHAIAEAQAAGGIAAFIDVEHALNPGYAEQLGVDLSANSLLFLQPDSAEDAIDAAEKFAASGQIDVIVIDSVDALVPKKDLEEEFEKDNQMAGRARLMSKACRRLRAKASKSDAIIIFINQIRSKVGVMFGSPKTTSGGKGLPFYASIRMEVIRTGNVKAGEVIIGTENLVKISKSKVGAPYREAKFEIRFGVGIDKTKELLNIAVEKGLIIKSGSWYANEGVNFAQGAENAVRYLNEDHDLYMDLFTKVTGEDCE